MIRAEVPRKPSNFVVSLRRSIPRGPFRPQSEGPSVRNGGVAVLEWGMSTSMMAACRAVRDAVRPGVEAPGRGRVRPVYALQERESEGESETTARWSETASLVRRAQVGDRDAFGRLAVQFEPTVYAVALRRLGNTSEAQELTQEVFLHVLRRLDQLREPERFAGWLRQVAARMAINRATRRIAPQSVETAVLEGAGEDRDEEPLSSLIARERAERLWDALGRLKSLDRETLVAFYIRGASLIEMADDLEVPLGTVKRRLHTARKRLKIELESSVADAGEWYAGGSEPFDPDAEPDSAFDSDSDEFGSAELVGAGSGSGRSSRW